MGVKMHAKDTNSRTQPNSENLNNCTTEPTSWSQQTKSLNTETDCDLLTTKETFTTS